MGGDLLVVVGTYTQSQPGPGGLPIKIHTVQKVLVGLASSKKTVAKFLST